MIDINNLPVLILAHSRADKFANCIKNIYEFGIRNIYVFIDGPRNQKDSSQQKMIMEEYYKYSNKCNLKINKLDKNLGNRDAVNYAVNWLFRNESYGVILEDDLYLSSNCFLAFSKLLKKYRLDTNIMSLSSHSPFIDKEKAGIFFSPVFTSWGWATWKNKWEEHQNFINKYRKKSMHKLFNLLPKKYRNKEIIEIVKSCQLRYLDAFDYEYNFTHLALGYSSITITGINMFNFGFDEAAAFCKDKSKFPFIDRYLDQEIDISKIYRINDIELLKTLKMAGVNTNNKYNNKFFITQKLLIILSSFIFLLRRIKRIFIKKPGFNIFSK